MAPTAAASEHAPSGALQLLLLIDSRTTVVRAQLDETLDSVLERLGHAFPRKGSLRVKYAGRRLPCDAPIGELRLPRDATLHLHVTSWSRSTAYHDAWSLASKVATYARIAATSRKPDFAASLDGLVGNFLDTACAAREVNSSSLSPSGPVAEHVAIFLRSGAPGVLGQLYLSNKESCRLAAERAIRRFLTLDPLTEQSNVKVWTAPVLLELSATIATGASARQSHADDPLYADLRRAVAALLRDPKWNENPSCFWLGVSLEWVAEHMTRLFATHMATAAVEQMSRGTQTAVVNKMLLAQFKTFSSSLRRRVFCLVPADAPWWTELYETLVSLLRSVELYMAALDTFMRQQTHLPSSNWMASSLPCVRVVMGELDAWSHVDAWPEIHRALRVTLAAYNVATRELVLSSGTKWWKDIWWIAARHRDLLDFDTRRCMAMALLPKLPAASAGRDTRHEMLVDRSRLLADSFRWIAHAAPEKLRADLMVEFKDEIATGPGVRREWFCMVFQALFSETQVLFSPCPFDRRRFFVNPISAVDPLHLSYYEFTGRMITLALMHEIPVGVLFDRTLFLQLAGRPITLDDIVDTDPSLHDSCKKILEMDPCLVDSDALGLTFIREVELVGARTVVELIPGGKDIAVNSKNLLEYIHLLIQDTFVNCTTNQVAYLPRGFSGMLTKYGLSKSIFDVLDVEDFNRILSATKDTIDIKEWEDHTEYNGFTRKSCRVKWFWKAVKAMTVDQQRRLLFFWTSVECLPFDGFAGLGSRLYMYKSDNSCDHLPTSGTCFYKLNLPAYTSFGMMQRRLQTIVQEHVSSSFGKS